MLCFVGGIVGFIDVGLLLGVLESILDSLDLTSGLGGRGRRSKRPPKLYLEALVLKEVFMVSLRYAENIMILCGRVPKSTLIYWEANHSHLVKDVLKVLLETLRLLIYDYTVLDSTKFTDWGKITHEVFTFVRVRLGEAIFPIHVETTTLEVEFTEDLPPGSPSLMERSTLSPY